MVYVKENKTKPYQPGHWSEKKKLEAVTTYLATGNYSETSVLVNVPRPTIIAWSQSDWWASTIENIRSGEGQLTDNKMSKIIDKALDMLMDHINDGDYIYDGQRGKLVKVPMKAADMNKVASTLFDKRQLIRNKPTTIKSSAEDTEARLLKLAQEFSKFVGKKKEFEEVVNEYIEGETVVQGEDGTYYSKEYMDERNQDLHEMQTGETPDRVQPTNGS